HQRHQPPSRSHRHSPINGRGPPRRPPLQLSRSRPANHHLPPPRIPALVPCVGLASAFLCVLRAPSSVASCETCPCDSASPVTTLPSTPQSTPPAPLASEP